jgi:hypothetical protein
MLSLDIDPKGSPEHVFRPRHTHRSRSDPLVALYWERLGVARICLNAVTSAYRITRGGAVETSGIFWTFTLTDFADLAVRMGWKVPDKFPPSRHALQTSDWALWHEIAAAELWKVVGLSLNIAPRILLDISPSILTGDGIFSLKLAKRCGLSEEFLRRYEIAQGNLNYDLPIARPLSPVPGSQQQDIFVSLQDFAAFAERKGWTLPAQFPRPAQQQKQPSTAPGGKPAESPDGPPPQSPSARESGQASDEAKCPGTKDLPTHLKIIAAFAAFAENEKLSPARIPTKAAEIKNELNGKISNAPDEQRILNILNLAKTLIESGKLGDHVETPTARDLVATLAGLTVKEHAFANRSKMAKALAIRLRLMSVAKVPSLRNLDKYLQSAQELLGAPKKRKKT